MSDPLRDLTPSEAESIRRVIDWFLLIGCVAGIVWTFVTHDYRFAAAFAWSLIMFEGTLFVMTWRWR
jgi:hypothetical protein